MAAGLPLVAAGGQPPGGRQGAAPAVRWAPGHRAGCRSADRSPRTQSPGPARELKKGGGGRAAVGAPRKGGQQIFKKKCHNSQKKATYCTTLLYIA